MSQSFRDVSIWPRQAYKWSKALTAYKEQCPTTWVIINATEFDFPMAKLSNPTVQSATWSSYKNRNTFKLLIGCTPNSALSFVSKVMVAVFQTRSWQREVAYLKSCSQETQSWLTVASTSMIVYLMVSNLMFLHFLEVVSSWSLMKWSGRVTILLYTFMSREPKNKWKISNNPFLSCHALSTCRAHKFLCALFEHSSKTLLFPVRQNQSDVGPVMGMVFWMSFDMA